nr:rRNA adenine N-6-methyltransferase family protein [uncultured Cetobacterium sp.]
MNMIFIKEFFKHFKEMGSIIPSSKTLSKAMVNNIDFKNSDVIVELGAGTGEFTDEILKRKTPETKLIIFEINKNLYEYLQNKYEHVENVIVLNTCASTLNTVLKELKIDHIDYIVSGLPFLSIPDRKRNQIFQAIHNSSVKKIVLFQYTLKLVKLMDSYFVLNSKKHVFKNFPPAYVLCFDN